MDWQIPLLVSIGAFVAFLLFKMRPAMTPAGRASATELGDAKRRIEAAKDDKAKAMALADAGDAAARLGRANGAVGFYLRALRADPRSPAIVTRAAASLARRPIALENLMWRHLAAGPFEGDRRAAAIEGLKTLAATYGRRRRNHFRAEALAHILKALGETT